MSGWQAVYQDLKDDGLTIIAAAQDSAGESVVRPWYERAKTTFASLVDEQHTISSLYNLVNVPSAVWIDESGRVLRIDEGSYASKHKLGEFEFGRDDYAPMVADWVANGDLSPFVRGDTLPDLERTQAEALAEVNFQLGVYFHRLGDGARASKYWRAAQSLNPASWNYHRQDWSFTPEEAGANWMKKVQSLAGKPYYRPIAGLD